MRGEDTRLLHEGVTYATTRKSKDREHETLPTASNPSFGSILALYLLGEMWLDSRYNQGP